MICCVVCVQLVFPAGQSRLLLRQKESKIFFVPLYPPCRVQGIKKRHTLLKTEKKKGKEEEEDEDEDDEEEEDEDENEDEEMIPFFLSSNKSLFFSYLKK